MLFEEPITKEEASIPTTETKEEAVKSEEKKKETAEN
jgi:hypothetical protein